MTTAQVELYRQPGCLGDWDHDKIAGLTLAYRQSVWLVS